MSEATSQFYRTIPKDRDANLRWRHEQLARAGTDPSYRATLKECCKQDLLFWINGFGWIAEQRKRDVVAIPFITFPFQDDALLRMQAALGSKIVVGDKSRDVGFSWCVLYLFCHRWQFFPLQSFGIGSRQQDLVDKAGNPDCLFWKLDHILDHQPAWLRPLGYDKEKHRTKNNILNPELGGDITGYATSKDIARGGRRLAILLDELGAYFHSDGDGAWASCESATDSIFAISTHQGTVGAFADACRSAQEYPDVYEYIVARWWHDPRKNAGLVVSVDPENPVEGMSKWTLENRVGKPWSLWYEWKCKRLHYNKRRIAEEVDGDPSAAGSGFFSGMLLELAGKYTRPPRRVGRLVYDPATCEPIKWIDDPNGNIKLWCQMQGDRPVMDEYGAGCDVAAGVGSTPSCINVVSLRLGEKMAEYADSHRPPKEFTCDTIALCKWFWRAKVIWETPGPGVVFSKTVRERGYRNLYYRKTNEGDLAPMPTNHIGWAPTPDGKRELLEDFRDALGTDYTERSDEVLKECKDWRYGTDGGPEQAKAKETDDPTKARHNHGDRVMAAALAWKLVKEGRKLVPEIERTEEPKPVALPGSVAWLMERDAQSDREREFEGLLRL